MDSSLWIAVMVTAAGTFAMRLLPLLWMQRQLKKHHDKNAVEVIPRWISLLGPLMIAAMLGVSLMPGTPDVVSWLATLGGAVATLLVWKYARSLGLPVLAGVVAFGLLRVLF